MNMYVLQEISCSCVHTMPRGIKATCIISGNRGGPHIINLTFQCVQQKPWRWPENKAIIILYVFPNTMTELNQKLAKSMPRRCSIRAIYTREKHLCTNLGVKEEGGHLLKGVVFLRNYSTYMISVWYT